MDPWVVLPVLALLTVVFVVLPVGVGVFTQWRRPLRLTCPRAGAEAQVKVRAARAAAAEVFGTHAPGIERCSLWPTVLGCRQECLVLPSAALRPVRRGERPPRPPGGSGRRTILVALDDSGGSEAVLEAVGPLARGYDATVRLLYLARRAGEVQAANGNIVAFADQESERIEREGRAYCERLKARLPGVTVEGAIRFGDPATEIVEEAETADADLIATVSHRRRTLGGRARSTLVRRLVRATTIPLLIVPWGERDAA